MRRRRTRGAALGRTVAVELPKLDAAPSEGDDDPMALGCVRAMRDWTMMDDGEAGMSCEQLHPEPKNQQSTTD